MPIPDVLVNVVLINDANDSIVAPAGAAEVLFDLFPSGGKGGDASVPHSACGGGGGGPSRCTRRFPCSEGDVISYDIQNGSYVVNVLHNGVYKGCAASRGGDGTYLQAGVGGSAQGDPSEPRWLDYTFSGGNGAPPGGDWGGGGGGGATNFGNGPSATGQLAAAGGGNGGITSENVAAQLGGINGGGGGGALGTDKLGKRGTIGTCHITVWGSS